MDNGTLAVAQPPLAGRSFGLRIGSVVAGLALVFAMVVLIQHRADAAPAGGASVTASVGGAAIGEAAQIVDFRQIVCPILLAVRNAFAGSPFFAFIGGIINQLLVGFGCTISPAA